MTSRTMWIYSCNSTPVLRVRIRFITGRGTTVTARQQTMNESLAPFTSIDAILAPETEENLDRYLSNGGSIEQACQALIESYHGLPDMIRALMDWTTVCGGNGEYTLNKALESVLKEKTPIILPRINEVLAASGGSSPVITDLMASSTWLPVVIDMASQNKNSAFHDLVMRETRLTQAGVDFSVLQSSKSFCDAIKFEIEALFLSGDPITERQLTDLYNRISIMCTYNECSTMLSIRFFSELARDAQDPLMRGFYRRTIQEVRKEAVNSMVSSSIVPVATARQYVTRLAIVADCISAGVSLRKPLIDAIMNILEGGTRRRFEKEIKMLITFYGSLIGDLGLSGGDGEVKETVIELSIPVEEKVFLIRALCHAEVFTDLIKAIFSHARRTFLDGRPDLGKRRCLCLLLSYVAVFIYLEDNDIQENLSQESSKRFLRMSMKKMFQKLESVAKVCEDLKPGQRTRIKGKPVETLLEGVKDPLIARGILLWASEGLYGGSDLRSLIVTAPKHLAFLEAIAHNHILLCKDILDVLREAYIRDYPGLEISQVEGLRKMFMKTIIAMVRCKMGTQTLLTFEETWVDKNVVDTIHLKNFVSLLLQTISPPYSHCFAASVANLLRHKRVQAAIFKEKEVSRMIDEFYKNVSCVEKKV